MVRSEHPFLLISIVIIIVFNLHCIQARPRLKTLTINGHQWTVPDEPGWETVLHEAEPIRHRLLTNCASIRECRAAAQALRDIFMRHAVSAKYYDDSASSDWPSNDFGSIFKWG